MIGVLLVLLAYVLGSLPMGLWIAKKVKGKDFDIRDHGSGNIGATNVLRILGWKVGLPVFLADFLKGYLPALLAYKLGGLEWGLAAMASAVLGHAYSFVMYIREGRFSGGKSVATAFGGMMALQPLIAGIAAAVFLLVLGTTRYLSLGSMLGAITAFVMAWAFHKGPFWIWTTELLALFILWTHRRNIGNLISGSEHKFGQTFAVHGEKHGVRVAFKVHPLSSDDYAQNRISRWITKALKRGWLSERSMRWIVAHAPIMNAGEITGVVEASGRPATVALLAVPMLPDQLAAAKRGREETATEEERLLARILDGFLKRGAVMAQRLGATIEGLGARLSSSAGGGATLQEWARKERKLAITISNGGAYTAAATLEALRKFRPDLTGLTVAFVGASGVICKALIFYFRARRHLVGRLLQFARTKSKVVQADDIETVLSTEELAELAEADVVIFGTSSEKPLMTAKNAHVLKPGAIVLDIAVPVDVLIEEVQPLRPDVTFIRCGLIQLPGHAKSDVDFHFGFVEVDGVRHPLVPACLAECLILASTGRYENASLASIDHNLIDWFIEEGEKYGMIVHASDLDERGIWLGRVRS